MTDKSPIIVGLIAIALVIGSMGMLLSRINNQTLSGISDVNTTNLLGNQTLVYNGSVWLNSNFTTGPQGIQGNSTYTNANPPWYDQSLVAYWQMNEGSGTTISDDAENSNTGTISGATWVQGKYGEALNFDGSAYYINCGNSATLKIHAKFTMCLWFNSVNAAWRSFLDKGWTNAWSFGQQNSKLFFLYGSAVVNGVTSFSAGWNFALVTYDGSTLTLYLNGVFDQQFVSVTIPSGESYDLTIAKNGGGGFYAGIIDDVRVYNHVLSQSEVTQLYNGQKNSYANQLWYKTTDNTLYQRNQLNSAWITVLTHQTSGFSVSTPAFPASGVDVQNTNAYTVRIYILTIGTTTAYTLTDQQGTTQSITTVLTAGMEITLDPLEKIQFSYTIAPTWKWSGCG